MIEMAREPSRSKGERAVFKGGFCRHALLHGVIAKLMKKT